MCLYTVWIKFSFKHLCQTNEFSLELKSDCLFSFEGKRRTKTTKRSLRNIFKNTVNLLMVQNIRVSRIPKTVFPCSGGFDNEMQSEWLEYSGFSRALPSLPPALLLEVLNNYVQWSIDLMLWTGSCVQCWQVEEDLKRNTVGHSRDNLGDGSTLQTLKHYISRE